MENETYTRWLNNEYTLWQAALKQSSIYSFKRHWHVIRMMGLEDQHLQFIPLIKDMDLPWQQLEAIDQIGSPIEPVDINGVKLSGVCLRFIYYANKVLNTVANYPEIRLAEIGGGYGGFCAVIQTIGLHKGIIPHYTIYDLPEVLNFQKKYLRETLGAGLINIEKIKFMYAPDLSKFASPQHNFIMSFYALGEFDTPTKNAYIENIISNVPHGLVIWNPHSGSDDSLMWFRRHQPNIKVQPEFPLTSINNQEVTW